MSGFVYLADIPPKARAVLHERLDPEDVQEWWNLKRRWLDPKTRTVLFVARPRDVWRQPGGASRVKAALGRMETTRPGLRVH